MSSCPSLATLALLEFEPALSEGLQTHVDACAQCQERLEELLAHDREAGSTLLPLPDGRPDISGFKIECELHRGGMSVVYQAYQESLDRRVAIKVVGSGPAAGTRSRTRWIREARAFTRINHEHVVRLYQVGECDGWLYLVLELVPGGSLESRLEQPLDPREAADLVRRLSNAVEAFHARRLLHMDLKPSNILSNDGPDWASTVKVSDFGIAHLFGGDADGDPLHPLPIEPLGTPAYMSPEQTTGDVVQFDPAPDVYGLGAILYQALTGRPPHEAPSIAETLEQVRTQKPTPPRALRPAIPRDLETICLKCLEKDPRRRYSTARLLGEELARWLDGKPILARPVRAPERAWIACRRRPLMSALAGALAVTLLVGLGASTILWRNAEAAKQHADEARERSLGVYQFARGALSDLFELGTLSMHDPDVSPAQLVARLEKVRRRIRTAMEQDGSDPELLRLVALVGHRLASEIQCQGRTAAAIPILDESLDCCDRFLVRSPDDSAALRERWHLLLELAGAHAGIKNHEKAAQLWEQAIRASANLADLYKPSWYSITYLSMYSIIMQMEDLGKVDQAGETGRRSLALVASNPGAQESPRSLAARIVLEYALDHLGTSAARDHGRRRLLDRVHSSPVFQAFDESERLVCLEGLAEDACSLAAHKRHMEQRDQAALIVDDIRLMAEAVVQTHPGDASSHWIMSLAYHQLSKKGYLTNDLAAVVSHLRRSMEEAELALRLEPDRKKFTDAILQRRGRIKQHQADIATRLSSAAGDRAGPKP